MDPSEMIVAIVGIIFGFLMLRMLLAAIFGAERMGMASRHPKHLPSLRDDGAVQRLEGEVRQLKDRVRVLERITVEDGSTLAAEIERLREPAALGYGGEDVVADPLRSADRV